MIWERYKPAMWNARDISLLWNERDTSQLVDDRESLEHCTKYMDWKDESLKANILRWLFFWSNYFLPRYRQKHSLHRIIQILQLFGPSFADGYRLSSSCYATRLAILNFQWPSHIIRKTYFARLWLSRGLHH